MEKIIELYPNVPLQELFGKFDENIMVMNDQLDVDIFSVNNNLVIRGEREMVEAAEFVIDRMQKLVAGGEAIDLQKLEYAIMMATSLRREETDFESVAITSTTKGKIIKPKTKGQAAYVKAITQNTLTFGIGPAGTGKTYLAVAMAAKAYKKKEIDRIIITRPAIEAGEKLGFLPGDLQDKVDPYLRPVFDALSDIFGFESMNRMREKGLIEVAPLAYMRGRTLDNSFIILDEAQNTTKDQMKMFLTRFGFDSKVVVNGDITQTDLPRGRLSGLTHASQILSDLKDVAIVRFTRDDVVRHSLVKKILDRYENQ
ncbi:MAG TPA: phosphate starvation-inducible protein PhoH [Tissierellia bacterium]|nr:phosphate starvation-inducible protein PhoH [Tissierellia bacterium]